MTNESGGASPFTLTVASPETWKRVIGVEVNRGWFDDAYGRNLRTARKGHARPGFRKGKVPLDMVEKDLGGEVRLETVEQVLPKAYQAAVIEYDLSPVGDPELTQLDLEGTGPVRMQLSVEVRPEVTAVDYDDLPLTEHEVALADGAVDEALERLRERRAVWERADRAAAAGDRVLVDIAPKAGDEGAPTEGAVTDYVFEIGAPGNFEAFDAALTDAVAGDSREVTVTYPDDYANERVRGRTVTYAVDLKEVQAKQLPDADDAFAASLKDGQTLLELRGALRDELLAEERRKAEQQSREQIVDLLVERNPLELPPSLVKEYVESGLREMKQRSSYLGRPVADADEDRYREQSRPWAERSLKAMLILEAIRRQEKIEVAPVEVDGRIDAIAAENGFPADQYREYVRKNREDERLALEIAEQKTFDFLRSRARFERA